VLQERTKAKAQNFYQQTPTKNSTDSSKTTREKRIQVGGKQKTTQTTSPKLDYIDATLEEILFSIPSAIGIIFGLSRGRHDLASSRAL